MARTPSYVARARWARTNANMLSNTPDGFVTTYGPMPWDAVEDTVPAWWYGSDQFGGPIGPHGPWANHRNSLLPSVTRCTNIIAGSIVRAPWRLVDPDGELQDRPTWLVDPMLLGSMPGPSYPIWSAGERLDGPSFWSTWVTHALWWGLGAFMFQEAADGTPLAGTMRLLNPFMVGTSSSEEWVINPNSQAPVETANGGRFTLGGRPWRLTVLRGMSPNDGTVPEGVLIRHFATFRLGASVSKYVSDMFASGGVPSGLLKVSTPGLKRAEADALRDSWMQAHGGTRRSVAVLNATVDYQPVTLTPVDAGAEGLLHASRVDVAHAFNLSSIWLDEGACVDEATTAYTCDRGWVGYEDLHEGDEVLALNHETGLAEWSRVTAMNVYDVTDQPVVEYGSAYHSSVTTLAHRWPVLDGGARRWTTTGEGFDRSMSITLGAPLADLPTEAKYTDAFVEMVAWHYTEGHWAGTARNIAYVSQSRKNSAECARIRAALTALIGTENAEGRNGSGASWYECREVGGNNKDMSVFRLSREASAPLLDLLGPGKIVPFDFIDSLTRAQLELFLHVSVLADGHHGKSGDRALLQREPAMFAGFQRAALLLGIPAPVAFHGHQHRISLPTRTTLRMRGQKASVRLHTGTVWCPRTEHGTWLASRDGKPFFTGNSGLTYQNSNDRRRDLLDLTLAAPAGKIGAVLSALMPYGWELSKDFGGFTMPTFEESIPTLVQAVEAGILTGLEARQRLGLAADTGPDPDWEDHSPAVKDPIADTPPQLLPFTGQQPDQQGQGVDPNA